MEQVEEAISSIDGIVIGYQPFTGEFTIQVPRNTLQGLFILGDGLLAEHPDLFLDFDIIISSGIFPLQPEIFPNYVSVEQERGLSFRFEDNWGLTAINASSAWDISRFEQDFRRSIEPGIIDLGIRRTHEALQVPDSNARNNPDGYFFQRRQLHGTQVMSIFDACCNLRKTYMAIIFE